MVRKYRKPELFEKVLSFYRKEQRHGGGKK